MYIITHEHYIKFVLTVGSCWVEHGVTVFYKHLVSGHVMNAINRQSATTVIGLPLADPYNYGQVVCSALVDQTGVY